jgi:tetratricopeptide (TPR) repeat protein
LTIQAIASDTSALPSTATFDTIVRTEVGGPFLYLQWITTNDSAKQGDTNVTYSIKVTNLGSDFNGANPAATNVTFDWNIPAKWTALGELRSWQTSLAKNAYVTKLLSVNIASDATLGTQTVLFTSGCNNDNNKTQQSTTTTIITDALGNTGDGVTPPSGPGTGGPGGGGSGGGGASPFTGTQKDVFFQTSEFFELVRGEDNSFSIKFTNPLDNNLTNLTLEVNGLLSNYLKLKDTKITKLDSNEEFTTSIEITSPKYFSPGEYELTFTINGTYGKTQFKEERKVILLIHDTNKTQAKSYLTEMKLFIEELTQSNLKTTQIPELLKDANALFNTRDYDGVKDKYSEAKIIFDSAIDAMNKTQNISGLIGISSAKGINTPNTNRLFTLAQLALQRGDYALALSRLKEAELTYSLETKGEFNMFVWILGNLDRVALMLILFIIATFMFIKGITLLTINMKLKNLNSENNLLLNLITALQIKTFSENNTSLGEYYDALTQFENRIAEVSEGIIEMMSKRNNTLNFAPQTTRLTQEKKSLLKLIKDTQKQYFDLGLVETRIYKTKLNSLTKRLSEVEEQIVTNDLKKTIRTQGKGITKHAWRTYYKLFK